MDSLQDVLKGLSLGEPSRRPPTFLEVRPRTQYGLGPLPKIQGHKLIKTLRIGYTDDSSGSGSKDGDGDDPHKDAKIPVLIPEAQLQKVIGIYLGTDIESATLIPNYVRYHEHKQKAFLQWILDSGYLTSMTSATSNRPNFISFGGRITDPMMTPGITRYGDWDIYAVKFHGSIYLWDEKDPEEEDGHKNLETYFGIYFEHLLTCPGPKVPPPNEPSKVFVVNTVNFGLHSLLVLNEIDAQQDGGGDTGDWVEIKLHKTKVSPKALMGKYLKFWAQSVLPGVTTIVIGQRDDQGILRNVKAVPLARIEGQIPVPAPTCINFENRLLDWISSHFEGGGGGDPKVVKKISWKTGDPRVIMEDVPQGRIPKMLLPDWYIKKTLERAKVKDDDKDKGKGVPATTTGKSPGKEGKGPSTMK